MSALRDEELKQSKTGFWYRQEVEEEEDGWGDAEPEKDGIEAPWIKVSSAPFKASDDKSSTPLYTSTAVAMASRWSKSNFLPKTEFMKTGRNYRRSKPSFFEIKQKFQQQRTPIQREGGEK